MKCGGAPNTYLIDDTILFFLSPNIARSRETREENCSGANSRGFRVRKSPVKNDMPLLSFPGRYV